ncbi:MAG: AAA family ATPase, partial [Polyangiales bacterium]
CEGRRSVVLVKGGAGIGKSRLVEHFAKTTCVDANVAFGRCKDRHGVNDPFSPIFDVIDVLSRCAPVAWHAALLRHAPHWAPHVLAEPRHDGTVNQRRAPWILGQASPMIEEFAIAVESFAAERTLVLVLEDLHWADAKTLGLVQRLAERKQEAKVLVIATFRPSQAVKTVSQIGGLGRELEAGARCRYIRLTSFSHQDSRNYLYGRFRRPDLPEKVALHAHRATGGDPLLLKLLADVLLDSEHPLRSAVTSHPKIELSGSVLELLDARIAALSDEEKDIVSAASIVGFTFSAPLIAAALGDDDDGFVERVEATCHRLSIRHSIFDADQGEEQWPDGRSVIQYRFHHGLLQQLVSERIAPATKRKMHRAVAQKLSEAYKTVPSRIAGEIADHFERGSDFSSAFDFRVLAAKSARDRFAMEEAVTHLEAAIKHLEVLEERPNGKQQEAKVRLMLARSKLYTSDGHPRNSARDISSLAALAATLPVTTESFAWFAKLWRFYSFLEEAAAANQISIRALRFASTQDNLLMWCWGLFSRAVSLGLMGDQRRAATHYDHLMELTGTEAGKPFEDLGLPNVSGARFAFAFHYWLVGRSEEARLMIESYAEAGDRRHPYARALAHGTAAYLAAWDGRFDVARDEVTHAVTIARAHHLSIESALRIAEAWILLRCGDARAAKQVVGVPETRKQIATGSVRVLSCISYADICVHLGRVDEGVTILDCIEDAGRERRLHWLDAEAHRLRGELWLASGVEGRKQAAEQCFRRAIDVSRTQGAVALERRAVASLEESGSLGVGRCAQPLGHPTRSFLGA